MLLPNSFNILIIKDEKKQFSRTSCPFPAEASLMIILLQASVEQQTDRPRICLIQTSPQ